MEIIIKLDAEEQKFVLKYLRFKIQKMGSDDDPIYEDPKQPIIQTQNEYTIPSSSSIHFHMKDPNCDYKLTIEGAAPEDTAAGSFNIQFYSSNSGGGFVQEDMEGSEEDGTIEQLDLVEPVFYQEAYAPNNEGVIIKDRLFIGQLVHAVIAFKVFKVEKSEVEAKDAKKGKKAEMLV